MTKQERYAEALRALGEREVESRSRKFRAFTATRGRTAALVDGPELLWFLGKSGSLRLGRCASESYAVLDATKASLLKRGEIARQHAKARALGWPVPPEGEKP